MKVEQLMTHDPLTVRLDTSLKDVAAILSSQGISGLPVLDGDSRVLGVVSEADILRKEQGLGGPRGGVLGWLDRGAPDPKLEARTAGEAMTSPALTIGPGRPAAEAAKLMVERGINRLPVIPAAGSSGSSRAPISCARSTGRTRRSSARSRTTCC